ncbi:hypothetical protein DFH07DRAFT_781733 [Mycena maculata]|uniref:Uncharacterized protein n=1 Tax=Mycena maculata TaxID=230809 RepID=A0AAD7HWM2_9AGAR|nr:hypothetical protein DFH07DRAFT_781733 [Mycena maculata]
MPNLENLTLHIDWQDTVLILLDALKTSEAFLPRIRTIAFYVFCGPPDCCDELRNIADALASRSEAGPRCCQLLDFEATFSTSADFLPSEEEDEDYHHDDIGEQLLRFQELKNSGMKIHIGRPEDSWV